MMLIITVHITCTHRPGCGSLHFGIRGVPEIGSRIGIELDCEVHRFHLFSSFFRLAGGGVVRHQQISYQLSVQGRSSSGRRRG